MNKKETEYGELFAKAKAAMMAAGNGETPTPMVVQQHENMMDDESPVKKQWFVSEGCCGFAWVVVTPGTSSFARWLKKNGHADKHYYGGVSIWISEFGQSVDRKMAGASAMAAVLKEAGYEAYADSRLD